MGKKKQDRLPETDEYKKDGNKAGFALAVLMVLGFMFSGIGIVAAQQVMLLFVFTLIFVIIFGALAVLFILKTNAWPELIASMRGTPLLKLYRRDRSVQTVACRMSSGMAETRKNGRFIVTPDSVFRDKKTGLVQLAAFTDYGVTLNPKMPMVATKLKEQGINNITEAELINQDLKKDQKRQIAIPIPFMQTVKFDDIIGFFKYNVSPHYISAAVERRVTIAMQGTRQLPLGWISMIAVLLVCAAIAYMIIINAGGGTQVIERVVPAVPTLTG